MTIGQAEASFREAIIKAHKEVTGRGPKDVHVKIFRNMIVFDMEDIFTLLEDRLLGVSGGQENIIRLRNEMNKSLIPLLKEAVEEIVECKVEECVTRVFPHWKSQYGILILDKNIEKNFSR